MYSNLFRTIKDNTALLIAAVLYVFTPDFFLLKFLLISIMIWIFLHKKRCPIENTTVFAAAAVLAYSTAFILSPATPLIYATIISLFPPQKDYYTIYIGISISGIIFFTGLLWLWNILPRKGIKLRQKTIYDAASATIFFCIFFAVTFSCWIKDMPYGGDEAYYFISTLNAYDYLFSVFGNIYTKLFILIWIISGLRLLWIPPHESRKVSIFLWGMMGIICFLYISAQYASASEFFLLRTFSNTTFQTWLSALIASSDWNFWHIRKCFQPETMRFLPLLGLLLTAVFFSLDRRWHKTGIFSVTLVIVTIQTMPSLYYHGTILQPDTFLIPFLLLLLWDAGKWMKSSYRQLKTRWSWPAAVLLGFLDMKASFFLIILILIRLVFRLFIYKSWRKNLSYFMAGESAILFACFLPLFFYCVIWTQALYGLQFSSSGIWNNWTAWTQKFDSLAAQVGFSGILAVAGIGYLLLRRDFIRLSVSLSFFLGGILLSLAELPMMPESARINLIILPPVIFWIWEGFYLATKINRKILLPLAGLIFISNLVLGPVKFDGGRNFGQYGTETWYPFSEAMLVVKKTQPFSRILFGNMEYDYAIPLLFTKTGFGVEWKSMYMGFKTQQERELARTLDYALATGYNTVIFRCEGSYIPSSPNGRYMMLCFIPSEAGGLAIFLKTNSDPEKDKQAPPPEEPVRREGDSVPVRYIPAGVPLAAVQ